MSDRSNKETNDSRQGLSGRYSGGGSIKPRSTTRSPLPFPSTADVTVSPADPQDQVDIDGSYTVPSRQQAAPPVDGSIGLRDPLVSSHTGILASSAAGLTGQPSVTMDGSASIQYNVAAPSYGMVQHGPDDIIYPMISTEPSQPLVRGFTVGRATREPLQPPGQRHIYEKSSVEMYNETTADICEPPWSREERRDMRRIVRVIREQYGSTVKATFQIVRPQDVDSTRFSNCLEVSCLLCLWDSRFPSTDDKYVVSTTPDDELRLDHQYFITSVEVVKLVLFLANMRQDGTGGDLRRESGRIRSSLHAFWTGKPINSKKRKTKASTQNNVVNPELNKTNVDFRFDLACRVMNYKTRKPRGFDKDVRILEWSNLGPAVKRAMKSYYVEMQV